MKLHVIANLFLRWWYAIAAPPAVAADAPRRERELVRKGRFISLVVLIIIVTSIPLYFLQAGPTLYVPLSICFVLLCFGLLLNRMGKTRLAGVLTVITLEASMCSYLLMSGLLTPGFSTLSLVSFYTLLEPELIAIALFSPRVTLPLGLFNCLFVLSMLFFLPKAPDLSLLIAAAPLAIYYTSISNMIIVILVSILWASSMMREMRRADRAEDVNKLTQALALRQQLALQEKRQLEESIEKLTDVHVQAATGNFQVRVPLDQQDALWPMTGPLNSLLARLQHWQHEMQNRQNIEQAVQQALDDVRQAKNQGTPLQIRKTGTIIDTLLTEVADARSLSMRDLRQTPWQAIALPHLNTSVKPPSPKDISDASHA